MSRKMFAFPSSFLPYIYQSILALLLFSLAESPSARQGHPGRQNRQSRLILDDCPVRWSLPPLHHAVVVVASVWLSWQEVGCARSEFEYPVKIF